MRLVLRTIVVSVVATASACVPDFETDSALVVAPRIAAFRAVPAEAREGEDVRVEALAVAPDGSRPELDFSLCLARKPLTELGPVNPACLAAGAGDEVLSELGRGSEVSVPLPELACSLFGPDRPDPKPGEPAGRPVDADASGGFYQPLVAFLDGEATLGAVRLRCELAGISRENSVDFNRRYRANENPAVTRFELVRADGSIESLVDGETPTVEAGERLALRVGWSECAGEPSCGDGVCSALEDVSTCADDCTTPKGCSGAESYALYDAELGRVSERTEKLVVSYLTTAGRLGEERSDAPPDALDTGNVWVAPARAGTAHLWVVIRDDRGGVGWAGSTVRID